MEMSAIYHELTEIFDLVFLGHDLVLTPELSAKDVEEWTSFKMIEIVMATEDRFDIKLSVKEVDKLQCVGDLAALIHSKAKMR